MPIPSPQKDEKQNEFISRCMGDDTMNKEFPENKQRAAVCYSQWKQSKKKSESSGSEVSWNDWKKEIEKNGAILHD